MKKNQNSSGAAILIYLLIMAVVVTVLLIATYSRLLLALKRGQSTTDALLINYAAESEISDWIARLSEGYLGNPFSVHEVKTIGNTTLTITGTQTGNTQKLVINADRPYASTQIEADRTVEDLGSNSITDIILSLDCTGSMKSKADPGNPSNPNQTRMDALKTSTLNFIHTLQTKSNPNIKVGIDVFGTTVTWLKTSTGLEIRPTNNIPLSEIETAVRRGFGYVNGAEVSIGATRENSPACQTVQDFTSIGSGFVFPQDYFALNKKPNQKQIEIIITDGEPNSRIDYPACQPTRSCTNCDSAGLDFLSCAVTDTNTGLPAYDIYAKGQRKGVRDPSVSAYAVTISVSPTAGAANVLKTQLGDQYYPIAQANSLPTILSNILTDILSKRETITIRKNIPN